LVATATAAEATSTSAPSTTHSTQTDGTHETRMRLDIRRIHPIDLGVLCCGLHHNEFHEFKIVQISVSPSVTLKRNLFVCLSIRHGRDTEFEWQVHRLDSLATPHGSWSVWLRVCHGRLRRNHAEK
jgi:hypothetical protein